MRTTASDRVARITDLTLWTSTIRTAVTMSTPASAASGMRATSPPPKKTTAISTTECTIADTRVRAPARTFTAVRAIAPVAGIPPKSGETTFASPWPNSSRSGSWWAVSTRPSATFADRRLSIAPRAATASAAPNRSLMRPNGNDGKEGVGSESGSLPIRATSKPASCAVAVAAITAISDAGRALFRRGTSSITAMTSATSAIAARCPRSKVSRAALAATAAAFSPSGLRTPSAAGTCCRKMIAAIPTVKPSITGQGMKARYRPRRATAPATISTPAMIPTTKTASRPCRTTIGASTTVIAPVGPDTWTLEPPNTAATNPATIAVTTPAPAPRPVVIPNARASGRATTPTVRPAIASAFHERAIPE